MTTNNNNIIITLQFVLEKHISSRTIAWFGAGDFSHVDCVLDDGQLLGARARRIAGIPAGVQIRPANYHQFICCKQMVIPCSEHQAQAYYEFLYKQIGKPYDSKAIWGFLFDRDWREDDSWICSELQAAAGEYSSILHSLCLRSNKITPVGSAIAFSAVGGVMHD